MRKVVEWTISITGLGGYLATKANWIANHLSFLSLPDDMRGALIAMSHIPTLSADLLLLVGIAGIIFLVHDYGLFGWIQWKIHAFRSALGVQSRLVHKTTPKTSEPLAPVPLHMALYVGHFWADFTHVEKDLHFAITLVLFNHTDQNIVIEGVRGNLVFDRFTNMATVPLAQNLPLTVMAHQHDGVDVTIRQSITKEEKDRICEVFASAGTLFFTFDLIRFLVHEPGHAVEVIRLHNIDGITCRLPQEGDIICGRLVNLHARLG